MSSEVRFFSELTKLILGNVEMNLASGLSDLWGYWEEFQGQCRVLYVQCIAHFPVRFSLSPTLLG